MFDYNSLIMFLTASIILLVIPGPAVIYITTQSIDKGTKAGLVSTVGIACGTLVHVIAASLGISAILVTSAVLFSIVKYIGAAYLVYLGIKKLVGKNVPVNAGPQRNFSYKQIFYEGLVVNVLNPKTALFFFSFLPQFINVSSGSVVLQMFMLGSIFTCMGIVSDGLYAITAAKVSVYIKKNKKVIALQNYFTGTVYIILGLYTALSGSSSRNK